ncbi:MAG TPA: polyamine aminopropyltransferase [bacterium]
MDLWFSETFGDIQAGWRVKDVLYHKRSQYQDVVIVDTLQFGRMLVLDGAVMTTEVDECAYHEMLVHPSLLAHPNPKSVCVVGGGDGGTVREVLKHSSVERVVLAEIDEDVITVCKEFMPTLAGTLKDPRVEIRIGDGAAYLAGHAGEFDVVLSDSTDPVGPGVVLFEDPYFKAAKEALIPGGLFVTQCKSLWVDADTARDTQARLKKFFKMVLPYISTIPTYPTGSWSFLVATDVHDPRLDVDKVRQMEIAKTARYYTPAHQAGAFAVPAFYFRP